MGVIKSAVKSAVKSSGKSSTKSHKHPKPKKTTPPGVKRIKTMVDKARGTKLASHSKYVSRTECYIALYLSFYYTVIQQYKIKGIKHVFDIYLPQLNLAVEYDGKRWHKDKAHDMQIDRIANSQGLKMLRIKEDEYYKHGKLAYVQKLLGFYDMSILNKNLTENQKSILKDFWK